MAVEHALTAARPKPRYLVGPDAKLIGHVVSRAPDRVRDAFVDLGGRRWERRAQKLGPLPPAAPAGPTAATNA